jgi:hypothetical protein
LAISRETPTHTSTTAGSTTKYTKNGGSIIIYRPGFCGEILIRVGPLVVVTGILVCVMEATYPLGCALPVPVLPH